MEIYRVQPQPFGFSLKTNSQDLELQVSLISNVMSYHATFFQYQKSNEDPIGISCMDLSDYQHKIPGIPFSPHQACIDVGAGLAEWIPELSRRTGARGTIIDPAPYERIRDMLLFVVNPLNYMRILQDQHPGFLPEFESVTKPRLYKLLSRIETILDPSKVRLINQTLGEAIRNCRDLQHCADVVIDVMGAGFYPLSEFPSLPGGRIEAQRKVFDLEKALLKKGGALYYYPGES